MVMLWCTLRAGFSPCVRAAVQMSLETEQLSKMFPVQSTLTHYGLALTGLADMLAVCAWNNRGGGGGEGTRATRSRVMCPLPLRCSTSHALRAPIASLHSTPWARCCPPPVQATVHDESGMQSLCLTHAVGSQVRPNRALLRLSSVPPPPGAWATVSCFSCALRQPCGPHLSGAHAHCTVHGADS
jgi:hypothetical protein